MQLLKVVSTYCLLLVFSFQGLQQLYTFVYFHINRDYIAANDCINRFDVMSDCKGMCQLMEQLDISTDDNEEHLPLIEFKDIEQFVFEQEKHNYSAFSILFNSNVVKQTIGITKDFCCAIDHPPQLT